MKILILANSIGGLYRFRKELIEELINLKHQVIISAPQGNFLPELKDMGCKHIETVISRHGTNPFTDFSLYLKYKSIIHETRPDIVFTYTIKPNIYGGLACQKAGVPYLANVTGLGTSIENGGLLSRISLFLYKLGLKGAKCVFFQNEKNQQIFLQKTIVPKEKAQLIPGSGVNLNHFTFEQYPSDETGIGFLFIGRIMKDKGIDELIEASRKIKVEYPNVTVGIIGSYDGNYETVISKAAREGVIVFHGYQHDVRPFIKQSHCVVLPSYHEGMANVLLEASATGRPVISTDVPGCKETFEEGETGFGCKAKDADSLYQAMVRFIRLEPEKRAEMGTKARKRVEQLFSRKIVIQKYLEMLCF